MKNIPVITIDKGIALLLNSEANINIVQCKDENLYKLFLDSLIKNKKIKKPIYCLDANIISSLPITVKQDVNLRNLFVEEEITNDVNESLINVSFNSPGITRSQEITIIIKDFDTLDNFAMQQIKILVGKHPTIMPLKNGSLVIAIHSGTNKISSLGFGDNQGISFALK
jgi:hypothetical protein